MSQEIGKIFHTLSKCQGFIKTETRVTSSHSVESEIYQSEEKVRENPQITVFVHLRFVLNWLLDPEKLHNALSDGPVWRN